MVNVKVLIFYCDTNKSIFINHYLKQNQLTFRFEILIIFFLNSRNLTKLPLASEGAKTDTREFSIHNVENNMRG